MRRVATAICALAALVLSGCGVAEVGERAAAPSASTSVNPTALAAPTAVPAQPNRTASPRPTSSPAPTALEQITAQPRPPQPTLQLKATLLPERSTIVPQKQPTASNPAPQATPQVDPLLASLAERARADLARRRGVAVETIEVVEARSVTWPNPGLGCPQPGMAYRQVPVDGVLIRLRIDGQIFSYHGGGGKAPFLCEQPSA